MEIIFSIGPPAKISLIHHVMVVLNNYSSRSCTICQYCTYNTYVHWIIKTNFFYFHRTRNDGLFAKANCSAVATIRELPSSKENRSSHGNNGVVKSGRVTTHMTETCDGHIPRHRASLPPVEVSYFIYIF